MKVTEVKFRDRTKYQLKYVWTDPDGKEWGIDQLYMSEKEDEIAQHIASDMPIEDIMIYIGDPILSHFVKYRLEKENKHA